MDICRITLGELSALVASGQVQETLSAAAGATAVILADDGAPYDTDSLATELASVPCVVVADPGAGARIHPLVDAAPGPAALPGLLEQVQRAPVAAAALALLLRGSPSLSIDEGLVAESVTYSMLQSGPEFAAWRAGRAPRPSSSTQPAVRVARRDEELQLTLDRPDVHNAFSARMRDELTEALTLALVDPTIRRVVLDGAGPSFCSGGDLREFGSFADPARAHLTRLTRSPARLIARLASRTEVRLHGACMGAGIELAAFAARVVADSSARIALPELGLGLVPGAGGTVSLPRRMGRWRAAELGLSGASIDAWTALDWGLVDEVVDAATAWPDRR